jgi:DNA-binding HxlR family transcriptional regulator
MVRREATESPLPLRSTYSLTVEAESLLPALNVLAFWGADRLQKAGLTWSEAQGPLG